MNVSKVSSNNCKGVVSSQHEPISQSPLSKRNINVVDASTDIQYSSSHNDSLKNMSSLVDASLVTKQNKKTSPKVDLIPLMDLTFFNSFVSLPVMNVVTSQEKIIINVMI